MVAIIINSYNRRELLENALASLWKILPGWEHRWAIVVFDAGSTDGSRELVGEVQRARTAETAGGSLVLVEAGGDDDRSFSGGINAAVARALTAFSGVEWLLLFETDNWAGAIQPFTEAISLLRQRPELAAVGFTVRRYSGVGTGVGCPFPTCLSLVAGLHLMSYFQLDAPPFDWRPLREGGSEPETGWSYCDAVFTSPIVISRRAWEQSGGLDAARFPFSDCDVDWAWRLRREGLRQGVLQTSEVVHDNRSQSSSWSATRQLHFHLARFRLLTRHRGWRAHLIKPLLGLRHLGELIAVLITRRSAPNFESLVRQRVILLKTCLHGYEGVPI